jgi:hypothetical protein
MQTETGAAAELVGLYGLRQKIERRRLLLC